MKRLGPLTAGLAGLSFLVSSAQAQDIQIPPGLFDQKPAQQAPAQPTYEKKDETKVEQPARQAPFDLYDDERAERHESPADTGVFKGGYLRLDALTSKDLTALSAAGKLVIEPAKDWRTNLYARQAWYSDDPEKEGVEDLKLRVGEIGLGVGKYFRNDDVIFYAEPQVFGQWATYSDQVELDRDAVLFGGKLGVASKDTLVMFQGLAGSGSVDGDLSPTMPYDDDYDRLLLRAQWEQQLTDDWKLRVNGGYSRENFKNLFESTVVPFRVGLETRVTDWASIEPFATIRSEKTEYDSGRTAKENYFGGGVQAHLDVAKGIRLDIGGGYDEEHKAMALFGIRLGSR